MVLRIELNDENIGWTRYGPSQYIPEIIKQWLVKYVWNRDRLSKYERVQSLYIVGPSKIGKTDTCYNLLNKDGKHCKVFVIDTYTNWKSFHDYLKENGLPDFVLVDDISIEELGREWKNLLGGQNTITYAISSTNKVTINYGRPCICLCNPDADVFNSNTFGSSKKSWLKDNLFGGEPIYLERDFINGMNVKQYSKFAGNIKCKNIDPKIREYIGFDDEEFESLPQAIQEEFLSEATREYIKELRSRRPKMLCIDLNRNVDNMLDGTNFGSIYDPFDHGSIGNQSFYRDTGDAHDHRSIVSQSFYYKPKDIAKAADAYVKWYKSTY
jgi:hypothetical protein